MNAITTLAIGKKMFRKVYSFSLTLQGSSVIFGGLNNKHQKIPIPAFNSTLLKLALTYDILIITSMSSIESKLAGSRKDGMQLLVNQLLHTLSLLLRVLELFDDLLLD